MAGLMMDHLLFPDVEIDFLSPFQSVRLKQWAQVSPEPILGL